MEILTLFLALFAFSMIHLLSKRKILCPGFLFNIIWLITLILYEMKLSFIQGDLTEDTIKTFYAAIFGFNIALFFMELMNFKAWRLKFEKNGKYSIEQKMRWAKYLVILIFVIEVIAMKGFPVYWKLTGDPRTYADFGIPSLNGAFDGLLVMLGAYSIFSKSNDKWLYMGIAVAVISRQVLLSMAIEAIIFAVVSGRFKPTVKKVGMLAVAGVLAFTVLGNFRSGGGEMDRVFQAREGYENLPSMAKWAYSYATFSVSNFNNLTTLTAGAVNHGASTLSAFLPSVIMNKIEIEKEFEEPYLVSNDFTVSTYLPEIYLDGGAIGVGIFNAVIAILGYQIFKRWQQGKSDLDSMMLAVFCHNIILLFFVNMFIFLPIIVQFIYAPILLRERKKIE